MTGYDDTIVVMVLLSSVALGILFVADCHEIKLNVLYSYHITTALYSNCVVMLAVHIVTIQYCIVTICNK